MLAQLNTEYPGQVRIFAHSLGNVVVGEALRQSSNGPVALTYVALQAALPSHSYDSAATNRAISWPNDSDTPNAYAHYWTSNSPCYFNGVTGASSYVNFFNPIDYALTGSWNLNQDLKPDYYGDYYYNEPDFYYKTDKIGFPTNTYRLFAYSVEARCNALGAQSNVAGPFVMANQTDLNGPGFAYGNVHKGHSAEFRSTNMQRANFWNRLLIRMQLRED